MPLKFSRTYLFFILFLSINVYSACNFKHYEHLDELKDLSHVKRIEIETINSKKWNKNSFRIINYPSFQIPQDFKKKYKGKLIVVYNFGECKYDISLRQLGDLKDHISFFKGNLIHSLKVVIKDGNVAGITKFNLFIPETRGLKEELVGVSILKNLNFLTPRTDYVEVKFNGNNFHMLFQESITKEFIENNNRPEGPIFEGDEKYIWDSKFGEPFTLENISLARQENAKWILKGSNYKSISLEAFSKLQEIYMEFAESNDYGIKLNLKKLSNANNMQLQKWKNFEILLIAMNGYHGLRPHNRKFFWNSFTKSFEPIYYDGNLKFKNISLSNDLSGSVSKSIYLDWAKQINSEDFDSVRNLLRNLSLQSVRDDISNKFLISKEEINSIVKLITKNIDKLQKYRKEFINNKLFQDQKLKNYESTYFEKFPEGKFLNAEQKKNNQFLFYVCDLSKKCQKKFIQDEYLIKIISSNLDNDKHFFFNNFKINEINIFKEDFFEKKTIKIISSIGLKINYEQKNNLISLAQSKSNDWALILDSSFEDFQINFSGSNLPPSDDQDSKSRINGYGLTGCLNFYNVNFKNSVLTSNAGRCEDSINLVSSFGSLKKISVSKSYYDALDMDFSNLIINRLEINNSGNDCVDVSYGNYIIAEAFLELCKDKSISIGERSHLRVSNLEISNSLKGISSKDFSKTFIENLSSYNVDLDLEAFNKKQEFGGSFLQVNNIKGDYIETFKDENSFISIN
jgi:hypothetical protein